MSPSPVYKTLKALADPSRLRILESLLEPVDVSCARDDGVCGCDFESLLGLSQPTVSHHLKVLVQAGLLRAEKRGKWTYYELERDAFGEAVDFLERFRGHDATSNSAQGSESGKRTHVP